MYIHNYVIREREREKGTKFAHLSAFVLKKNEQGVKYTIVCDLLASDFHFP